MSKANSYERQYQETRNCCGEPFPEVVQLLRFYDKKQARVLDLGCGQGRDALMAARHGSSVLGVDSSKTGIRQMLEDAETEGLNVQGVVADLNDYEIDGDFDIIILDRVLHMLEREERICVLQQAIRHVSPDGFILIADMPSNKPLLRDVFRDGEGRWRVELDRKGLLFMRRESENSHPSSQEGY